MALKTETNTRSMSRVLPAFRTRVRRDKPLVGPFTISEPGSIVDATGRRVAWLGWRKKGISLTITLADRDRIEKAFLAVLNAGGSASNLECDGGDPCSCQSVGLR